MKITYPPFGDARIAIESMLRGLGHTIVPPPPSTNKTLSIGVKYAPEFACLPLKITLGNYIEAIEEGADTILMLGGIGPCRFGYYAEVQRRILKDLGYNVDWIILDLSNGWGNLLKSIKRLVGRNSPIRVIRVLQLAWEKVLAIDEIEKLSRRARPFERYKGEVDKIVQETHKRLDQAESISQVKQVLVEYREEIDSIIHKNDLEDLVKIGIVGEFYVVLDHFTNFEIAKRLGDLGVLAENAFYIEEIVRIYFPLFRSGDINSRTRVALPYIKRSVGGEGQRTIAHTIEFAEKGFDGVIHLLPFTCMPEVVAEGVLERVSRDYNIPVLTLSIDEQTGLAGINTRIEAFVDMLKTKKSRRKVV
jgi:predicted nucleotide-binding protein (sugar kinase/HSP70/actin superfamily)